MAVDFFDRQDHARRQTQRLVILFALAVAVIIVAVYLVAAVLSSGAVGPSGRHAIRSASQLWNPQLFAAVAVGTIIVVSLGSLYKISQLAAGGEQVALMLGGRQVDPQSTDLAERRLLNIVEEMALASGVPVPPVFVLDNESSINAFAAGHQPGDAVVAVSRGSLEYLNREELQGVIAHEFSHILNGDMRLNLRLIGVVHGILVLAIIGYYVMRSTGGFSSRSEKDKGGAAAVFFIGLALVILGYLGVLLGHIIKSAISRQREFLADASAVQFTRYPGGIAGALKKIGGLSEGSRIRDPHAEEVSHMFFGDAFAGSFFNLFATHPPLAERIRSLEPDFDGHFPEVQPLVESGEPAAPPTGRPSRRGMAEAAAPAVAMGLAGGLAARVGQPHPEHLAQAGQLMAAIPPPLLSAVHEPFSARAVVFALLLSRDDPTVAQAQFELLQAQVEPLAVRQTQQLAALVAGAGPAGRLPLVDLTIPALKQLSPHQYAQFRQTVEQLAAADGKLDLFEYCLRTLLFNYLDVHFGLRRPTTIRYRSIAAVAQPLTVVLSALAYAGHDDADGAQRAFEIGVVGLLEGATVLPAAECTFQAFDMALADLASLTPMLKRDVLAAVLATISADGTITLKEDEMLRAVAAGLNCPLPPALA